MKILLTGSNGFFGRHFMEVAEGQNVDTLSRSKSSVFQLDLRKKISKDFEKYDLVVHAAGKAHSIPKTEIEAEDFFRVNEKGTANLLEALSSQPPKKFVLISTVAVYGVDKGENICEEHPLNSKTPYGLSKINAERITSKWCKKHDVRLQIIRLPLICGNNPPGNLESMINGIKKGYYLRIGKGLARKSMVGSIDVANLILGDDWQSGIFNLTDGIHPTIAETEERIAHLLNKSIKTAPLWLIKILASVGNLIPRSPLNTSKVNKLILTLTFSELKARKELNWNPNPALSQLHLTDGY